MPFWYDSLRSKENSDKVSQYVNDDFAKSFYFKDHYPKCKKIDQVISYLTFFRKMIKVDDPNYKSYQEMMTSNRKDLEKMVRDLHFELSPLNDVCRYLEAILSCLKKYPDNLVLTDYFFELVSDTIRYHKDVNMKVSKAHSNNGYEHEIEQSLLFSGRSIVVMANILNLYDKKYHIKEKLSQYSSSFKKLSNSVHSLKTSQPEERRIDIAFMPIRDYDRRTHKAAISELEESLERYNRFLFKITDTSESLEHLISTCVNDKDFTPSTEFINLVDNHLDYLAFVHSGVAAAFQYPSIDVVQFGTDFKFLTDVLIFNFSKKNSVR